MADTMRIQNVDCDVVYVDPGASGSNNGSTPSDALTGLPDPDTWVGDTVYLCRRGTSDLTFNTGSVTDDNVYLFGMPKSGDLFYDVTPASAKAIWDADVADFANIAVNSNRTLTMNQDCGGFFGIDFKQNGSTTIYTLINISDASSWNHFVINCKFRNPTYDLTTTSIASSVWTGVVKVLGHNATVERCYAERQARDADATASGHTHMFEFDGDHCSISDCELWVQSSSYDSSGTYGPGGVKFAAGLDHITSNLDIRLVENIPYSNDSCFNSMVEFTSTDGASIKDVDITFDRAISTHSLYRFSNICFAFTGMDENILEIDGLNIDFQNLAAEWPSIYLHIVLGSYQSNKYATESTIKNIDIKNPSVNSSITQQKILIRLPPQVVVEDCNFRAGSNSYVELVSSNPTYESGFRTKNLNINGLLRCIGMPYVDITSQVVDEISSTPASYSPIYAEASTIHVKDLTIPESWTTETVVQLQYRSNVFIDNINGPLYYYHASASTYRQHAVYANNVNGLTGRWEGHSYRFHGETNAAFRTGGANASIKLTGDASDDNPLWLGKKPFPGLKLSPSSTGDAIVSVYIAHKLFTNPQDLLKYFNVLVHSPDTAISGVNKCYSSSIYGNWVDDDSVWNNDDGLTIKRCDIPIKIDRIDDIEVRIAYNWYENTGGYLYLDPQLVLT